MKKIFRNKYVAILIGAIVLGPIACKDSFLEVPIAGNLTETQLASQSGLEKLLIGVYANINGRDSWHGGSTNWLWGSIRGGDANKGTNAGDFNSMNPVENYNTETTNSEVAAKWAKSYEGVARANFLLSMIPKTTDADPTVAARIEAEAKFLRGFYYFELKKNFNMVPYVDETMDITTSTPKEVKNDKDIWPMIEADLKFAYDNLKAAQAQVGRVNKYAAGAFYGKALLYQGKYAAAKVVFDDVIANGQTSDGKKYALAPSFADLFRLAGENSSESVFAFQATGAAQNVNNSNQEYAMAFPYNTLPGNCCGFFQPSFDLAASYRVNALGLPLSDNSYRLPANDLKTDYNVPTKDASYTPDAGLLDPRLDITIGRRGIPFLDWGPHLGFDWIRDQIYAGPYTPKKYTYSKAESGTNDGSGWTPGYTATNFMIMRYADVLLMAAECEIEVGSLATAAAYVNQIRTRAANTAAWVKNTAGTGNAANYLIGNYVAFASKADAITAVRFERKLELGMEGHRFYDLNRWGTIETDLNAYMAYEKAKIPSHFGDAAFTKGRDEWLPIPQRQIDLQGADILKQNPGY